MMWLVLSGWAAGQETPAVDFSALPEGPLGWVIAVTLGVLGVLREAGLLRLPRRGPAPDEDEEATQTRALPPAVSQQLAEQARELEVLRAEKCAREQAEAAQATSAAIALAVEERLTPALHELAERLGQVERRLDVVESGEQRAAATAAINRLIATLTAGAGDANDAP